MAPAFQPSNQHGEMVRNLLSEAETEAIGMPGQQSCPKHPGFAASMTYMANSLGDIANNEERHHAEVKDSLQKLVDKMQKMITEHAVLKTKVAIYAVLFASITSIIVSPIMVIVLKAILK